MNIVRGKDVIYIEWRYLPPQMIHENIERGLHVQRGTLPHWIIIRLSIPGLSNRMISSVGLSP